MIRLTACPTCGSKKLKAVRKTVTRQYKGERYTVPDLEFQECPNCGEKLYDRDAMHKIEAVSPAYDKRRPAHR